MKLETGTELSLKHNSFLLYNSSSNKLLMGLDFKNTVKTKIFFKVE